MTDNEWPYEIVKYTTPMKINYSLNLPFDIKLCGLFLSVGEGRVGSRQFEARDKVKKLDLYNFFFVVVKEGIIFRKFY